MNKRALKNYFSNTFYSFIFYGLINVFFTNVAIQIFLLSFDAIIATLIGQIINFVIGFNLYKNKVFRIKTFKKIYLIKYLLLHLTIWNLNWFIIEYFYSFGISKNLSALFLILPLAFLSYLSQKYIVFKIK